jgi:hypothetical protein
MSTDEAEALKRRYREFLDLMPLTLALAGLAHSEGKRNFTAEELEYRGQVLLNSFKVARHVARDAIRGGPAGAS